MSRKARIWIGTTLLAIIAINYAIIAYPLYHKVLYINDNTKALIIKDAKAKGIFKGNENEFLLDLFRKERSNINRKIVVLNCVSASFLLIVISWTLFGLIVRK